MKLSFVNLMCLALAALATGCVVNAGTDGRVKVISCRLLWKSEDISFGITSTNLTARLSIGKSGSDEQSIKSAVDAAVSAAVRAYSPKP